MDHSLPSRSVADQGLFPLTAVSALTICFKVNLGLQLVANVPSACSLSPESIPSNAS